MLPSMHSILAKWAPAEEKSVMTAIVYAGTMTESKSTELLQLTCLYLLYRCSVRHSRSTHHKWVLDFGESAWWVAICVLCVRCGDNYLVHLLVLPHVRVSRSTSQDFCRRAQLPAKVIGDEGEGKGLFRCYPCCINVILYFLLINRNLKYRLHGQVL